jgi:hypothetical protein
MTSALYANWMTRWETALTTRDTNRIVRPVEWGLDWLGDWIGSRNLALDGMTEVEALLAINRDIVANADAFYSYRTPTDFRLEERHPELFPTNVRPETLAHDARVKQMAADGTAEKAQFLRFTSPIRTPYPENDQVNARWYPAPEHKEPGRPRQAIIVLPQWNADAFSHNVLCTLFNRFGVSALRLSKPFHDIRRPAELERSDYAVSSNIGRTIASCRQAVLDIRCCLDWLESQGYEHFGILGTSLGSCYGFIASALDARLRVNAFNHISTWFGDVCWTGQSTRHIRAAYEQEGIDQDTLRELFVGVSPPTFIDRFAGRTPETAAWPRKRSLLIHARYDLTFLREYSLQVVAGFAERDLDFEEHCLPCGHYTTGETPFKYIDGYWLGSFVYRAFKALRS